MCACSSACPARTAWQCACAALQCTAYGKQASLLRQFAVGYPSFVFVRLIVFASSYLATSQQQNTTISDWSGTLVDRAFTCRLHKRPRQHVGHPLLPACSQSSKRPDGLHSTQRPRSRLVSLTAYSLTLRTGAPPHQLQNTGPLHIQLSIHPSIHPSRQASAVPRCAPEKQVTRPLPRLPSVAMLSRRGARPVERIDRAHVQCRPANLWPICC